MNQTTNTTKVVIVLTLIILAGLFAFIYGKKGAIPTEVEVVDSIPQEERIATFKSFEEKALSTNIIDISACKPYPEVAEFKLRSSVTFLNKDSFEHKIWFTPSQNFVVPAKNKIVVNFNFFTTPGLRKYNCDDMKAAGAIIITR